MKHRTLVTLFALVLLALSAGTTYAQNPPPEPKTRTLTTHGGGLKSSDESWRINIPSAAAVKVTEISVSDGNQLWLRIGKASAKFAVYIDRNNDGKPTEDERVPVVKTSRGWNTTLAEDLRYLEIIEGQQLWYVGTSGGNVGLYFKSEASTKVTIQVQLLDSVEVGPANTPTATATKTPTALPSPSSTPTKTAITPTATAAPAATRGNPPGQLVPATPGSLSPAASTAAAQAAAPTAAAVTPPSAQAPTASETPAEAALREAQERAQRIGIAAIFALILSAILVGLRLYKLFRPNRPPES